MNSIWHDCLFCTIILLGYFGSAQLQCPKIDNPVNGDTDVPVDTQVSWNVVGGIDGYSVSLGTTEGGSDILNSRSAALVNFLTPVVGLPDNTEIFVTISLFLDDGTFITCPSEKFTTVDVMTPPNCTTLNQPLPGAEDVNSGEELVWDYAPTATGYKLSIGVTEMGEELLAETDIGNNLSYRPVENLPLNTRLFITITPYNENGDAQSCSFQTFTTGASNIDCDQFRPETNMPEVIGLCKGSSTVIVSTDDRAQGFRWYRIEEGSEVLFSEEEAVTISAVGEYRYEAYNSVSLFGDTSECTRIHSFSVVDSEIATIEEVKAERGRFGINIEVITSGIGNYEYALDTIEGPYTDSAIFTSIAEGNHNIFVRDKNGCGISEYFFVQSIARKDFPVFFTPNNDGINDYWQFTPMNGVIANLKMIFIFDRYGNLLSQLVPESIGWDGTVNGKAMPSSTYWYKATSVYDETIEGYFALKR